MNAPTKAPVIDSQVHAYERDHPARPWAGTLVGPAEATGDDLVAAMDAVGVDGALLVSPFRMYRYDGSYALEVQAKHPRRFGLIKPFDPQSPSIEEEMSAWAEKPGVVGARLMLTDGFGSSVDGATGFDRLLVAARNHGLPVNVLCWRKLRQLGELAARHPDTQLVIDHLGLPQPFHPPPPTSPSHARGSPSRSPTEGSFADLPDALALAKFDNVAIKISGACTLSHQPFPYPDIWEPLQRLFDAYGFQRCLWGTDWTRAVELLTYEQGVEAFRVAECLSDAERDALMGGSLANLYGWRPTID